MKVRCRLHKVQSVPGLLASIVYRDALNDVGAEVLPLSPRSLDSDPIENVFNNIKLELAKEHKKNR